jgi:MFS family permease
VTNAVGSPGPILRQFPAFASRDFRLLFTNSVFVAAANWALILARGWLVYDLTKSSTAVGIVTFAGMAPYIFAAPIAGALADRLDRRWLAIQAAWVSIIGTGLLALVTALGMVEVWHVVFFALLGGVSRAAQQPTANAMAPSLVPPEHLMNAIALQSVSVHGSRIIGPLYGAILLETIGPGAVFGISALAMVVGTGALWAIRYRTDLAGVAPRRLTEGLFTDVAEGIGYVFTDRRLALVVVLVIFHCGLTMAFDSLMPALADGVGGGERTYSAILIALGAGAVVGTVSISRLVNQATQGRALAIAGFGSGGAMVVLGLGVTPQTVVVGAFLAGATQAAYMSISQVFVLGITPDRYRGRVMATFIMVAAGHMAFVNLGFGATADILGVRPLLIVPGLVWTAVFLGAFLAIPELRLLLRTGRFREYVGRQTAEPIAGG